MPVSADSAALSPSPSRCARPAPALSPDTRRRARRVALLLATLLVLGFGDLYATYTHASTIGMYEENPVGAYLIGAQSWAGLVLYKIGTMGVSLALLLKVRHHGVGEAAAWLGCLIMVALTIHWYHYNDQFAAEMANASYEQIAVQMRLAAALTP